MKIDTSASLTHSLTNNVDKKELSVLKKEDQDKIPVQDLSSLNSDGVKVVFENKQGELIALNLSDENYSSLQKNFGSYTNYVARNDGSIRLNGKANQFVSNWFESVKDNFGSLNSNLNNKQQSVKLNFNTNTLQQSMQNLGFKTSDEKISDDANIEEKLNFFIDKDVNKDGKVDDSDVKEPSMREILSDIEKEDEDLLQKAQEKGLNALSADEQAKLEASNPEEFEKLKQKSLQELSQNLSKDFQNKIENQEAQIVDKRV
ncbi:TPA: hypothetical protein SAI70_000732 [Campylobacter jejuni]|nr:hypothetical protein [Campylobacter jejuni]